MNRSKGFILSSGLHGGVLCPARDRHKKTIRQIGKHLLVVIPLALSMFPPAARAGSAKASMPVTLTLTAGCTVLATPIALPPLFVLGGTTKATGMLDADCTGPTPFNVGLDQGSGAGATTTMRMMTGSAATLIPYGLFQNAALSINFGNTVGSDTAAGTAGASRAIVVYAEVPGRSSPAAGTFADIVNVTITF